MPSVNFFFRQQRLKVISCCSQNSNRKKPFGAPCTTCFPFEFTEITFKANIELVTITLLGGLRGKLGKVKRVIFIGKGVCCRF